jgi:hypothetical protein
MFSRMLWLLLCIGCVWATLFTWDAAVMWRAQGDSRANLCLMMTVAFGLGCLMTGHEALRKR